MIAAKYCSSCSSGLGPGVAVGGALVAVAAGAVGGAAVAGAAAVGGAVAGVGGLVGGGMVGGTTTTGTERNHVQNTLSRGSPRPTMGQERVSGCRLGRRGSEGRTGRFERPRHHASTDGHR